MVYVPCTVKGGLPVIASVWFTGPSAGYEDYDSGVDELYWQKKDGSRGKEVSKAFMDSVEKYDTFWQATVTEQANDWLGEHCPTRRYVGGPANAEEGIDHSGYITEGEWSKEYILLNGDPRQRKG
jgi:hypothetical protein